MYLRLICSLNFILFFPSLDLNGQNEDYLSQLGISDTLMISYIAGDEGIQNYGFIIYRSSKSLVLKRISPPIYLGFEKISKWKIFLNPAKRRKVNFFLNQVIKEKNCETGSSWRESYKVFLNDNLLVNPFITKCIWPEQYYLKFEKELFKKEFKKLAKDRKKFSLRMRTLLTGNWEFEKPNKALAYGDTIMLSRLSGTYTNNICIWEFKQNGQFNNRCSFFNLGSSSQFVITADQKSVLLGINPSERIKQTGDIGFDHLGLHFKIKEVDQNKMILVKDW